MSNKQETIADRVKEMRTLGRLDQKSTDKIPRSLQALGLRTYADHIEAAHKREVAVVLKDRDQMFKSEQETVAKTNEWFDEYQKLKREVAELRACLKMAVVNARIARTCCAFGRECDSCGQSCDARKWNKVIEATKGGKQ